MGINLEYVKTLTIKLCQRNVGICIVFPRFSWLPRQHTHVLEYNPIFHILYLYILYLFEFCLL